MYREYQPPTRAEVVHSVWTSTKVGVQRVVPDGCMDIIWNGHDLVVAGPDTTAFITEATGTGVGVRFLPGVAPSFLGVPAHEIIGMRVPLAEFRPRDQVERLIERVTAGKPGQALLDAVEQAEPDPFAAKIRELARTGEVRGMAEELGITERHLHRKSLARFGYGPKTLHRIFRFGDAMELVYAGKPFAEVAYQTGYADQAHLAREVKTLAGATLTTLVQDADVTR